MADVAGVAEPLETGQIVWRGQWRNPQQLSGGIEQFLWRCAQHYVRLAASTALVTCGALTSGQVVDRQYYYPYGSTRSGGTNTPTDFRYTGQRAQQSLGIYDYGARFYDPTLGRFLSADTIVPGAGNPQALNRYSYALNGPTRYIDPTGHMPTDGCQTEGCSINAVDRMSYPKTECSFSGNLCSAISGVQLHAEISIAFPFGPPDTNPDGNTRPALSGTNFHTSGISVVVMHLFSHPSIKVFTTGRDQTYTQGAGGAIRAMPGPAERAIGQSAMFPEIGIGATIGPIWGTKFAAQGADAFKGSSVVDTASAGLVTADSWAAVDSGGNYEDTGGADVGISLGTPFAVGQVAVVAEPFHGH